MPLQLAPSIVFNDPRKYRPDSMRVEFAIDYAVKVRMLCV